MTRRPRDKRKKIAKLLSILLLIPLAALGDQFVTGAKVTVGTATAVQIGSADPARLSLCFTNSDATNPIFCDGASTVTSSTGFEYLAGSTTVPAGICTSSCSTGAHCAAQGPVYCISTGGNATVYYWESR